MCRHRTLCRRLQLADQPGPAAPEPGRGHGSDLASEPARWGCPRHPPGHGSSWSARHGSVRGLGPRPLFTSPGTMLMSAYNGGVEHHVLVVRISCQVLEDPREHTAL